MLINRKQYTLIELTFYLIGKKIKIGQWLFYWHWYLSILHMEACAIVVREEKKKLKIIRINK